MQALGIEILVLVLEACPELRRERSGKIRQNDTCPVPKNDKESLEVVPDDSDYATQPVESAGIYNACRIYKSQERRNGREQHQKSRDEMHRHCCLW